MYATHILDKVLSEISKSLDNDFPSCFDDCYFAYRFIVEFCGNNNKVSVWKAEVLDIDWVLLEELTRSFSEKVHHLVEIRNSEYDYYKKQSLEIRSDRLFERFK